MKNTTTKFYGIYVGSTACFNELNYGMTGTFIKIFDGKGIYINCYTFIPHGTTTRSFTVSEAEVYNPNDESPKHFVPLSLEKRKQLLNEFHGWPEDYKGRGTERECDYYKIPKYKQV